MRLDTARLGSGRLGSARLGWAPIALIVIVVDQLTKHWAVNELADRDIDVVWTLRLNLSYNTGMAFSRGQDFGPIIGVLALVVVVVLLLSLKRQPGRLTDVSVGLIIGGAIGNVIDRLFRQEGWFRGGVVDFIDFQWFPIFNVADMGVTIGGALLVLASWLVGRRIEPTGLEASGPDDDLAAHRTVDESPPTDAPGDAR